MKTNFLFQTYAIIASSFVGVIGGFNRYDVYWLVFFLGGVFTLIGHALFDQKIKYSVGRLAWMITTSFITCLLIKILHDEKYLSPMSMIIATLFSSMVAPAVFAVILRDLPTKISEQILRIPEALFNAIKNRIDSNPNTKENE